LLLLLLSCAIRSHKPSAIEQRHHQPSKAAAEHPSAVADDEHTALFLISHMDSY